MTSDHAFPGRVAAVLSARTRVRYRDVQLKPASVLLPLFARDEAAPPCIWLMRRAEALRVHGGQVSLPGGQADPDDLDLLATALREAEEEIALPRAAVRVLGALDDYATVTGFVITPYVGWVASSFVPEPRASEVARMFAVPLALFEAPPDPLTIAMESSKRIVQSYRAEGEVVWGATAAILRRFVLALATAGVAIAGSPRPAVR